MSNQEIKVGSVVQLKSGGPLMTVETLNVGMSGNKVYCQWFDGNKLVDGTFSPDSLEVQQPE